MQEPTMATMVALDSLNACTGTPAMCLQKGRSAQGPSSAPCEKWTWAGSKNCEAQGPNCIWAPQREIPADNTKYGGPTKRVPAKCVDICACNRIHNYCVGGSRDGELCQINPTEAEKRRGPQCPPNRDSKTQGVCTPRCVGFFPTPNRWKQAAQQYAVMPTTKLCEDSQNIANILRPKTDIKCEVVLNEGICPIKYCQEGGRNTGKTCKSSDDCAVHYTSGDPTKTGTTIRAKYCSITGSCCDDRITSANLHAHKVPGCGIEQWERDCPFVCVLPDEDGTFLPCSVDEDCHQNGGKCLKQTCEEATCKPTICKHRTLAQAASAMEPEAPPSPSSKGSRGLHEHALQMQWTCGASPYEICFNYDYVDPKVKDLTDVEVCSMPNAEGDYMRCAVNADCAGTDTCVKAWRVPRSDVNLDFGGVCIYDKQAYCLEDNCPVDGTAVVYPPGWKPCVKSFSGECTYPGPPKHPALKQTYCTQKTDCNIPIWEPLEKKYIYPRADSYECRGNGLENFKAALGRAGTPASDPWSNDAKNRGADAHAIFYDPIHGPRRPEGDNGIRGTQKNNPYAQCLKQYANDQLGQPVDGEEALGEFGTNSVYNNYLYSKEGVKTVDGNQPKYCSPSPGAPRRSSPSSRSGQICNSDVDCTYGTCAPLPPSSNGKAGTCASQGWVGAGCCSTQPFGPSCELPSGYTSLNDKELTAWKGHLHPTPSSFAVEALKPSPCLTYSGQPWHVSCPTHDCPSGSKCKNGMCSLCKCGIEPLALTGSTVRYNGYCKYPHDTPGLSAFVTEFCEYDHDCKLATNKGTCTSKTRRQVWKNAKLVAKDGDNGIAKAASGADGAPQQVNWYLCDHNLGNAASADFGCQPIYLTLCSPLFNPLGSAVLHYNKTTDSTEFVFSKSQITSPMYLMDPFTNEIINGAPYYNTWYSIVSVVGKKKDGTPKYKYFGCNSQNSQRAGGREYFTNTDRNLHSIKKKVNMLFSGPREASPSPASATGSNTSTLAKTLDDPPAPKPPAGRGRRRLGWAGFLSQFKPSWFFGSGGSSRVAVAGGDAAAAAATAAGEEEAAETLVGETTAAAIEQEVAYLWVEGGVSEYGGVGGWAATIVIVTTIYAIMALTVQNYETHWTDEPQVVMFLSGSAITFGKWETASEVAAATPRSDGWKDQYTFAEWSLGSAGGGTIDLSDDAYLKGTPTIYNNLNFGQKVFDPNYKASNYPGYCMAPITAPAPTPPGGPPGTPAPAPAEWVECNKKRRPFPIDQCDCETTCKGVWVPAGGVDPGGVFDNASGITNKLYHQLGRNPSITDTCEDNYITIPENTQGGGRPKCEFGTNPLGNAQIGCEDINQSGLDYCSKASYGETCMKELVRPDSEEAAVVGKYYPIYELGKQADIVLEPSLCQRPTLDNATRETGRQVTTATAWNPTGSCKESTAANSMGRDQMKKCAVIQENDSIVLCCIAPGPEQVAFQEELEPTSKRCGTAEVGGGPASCGLWPQKRRTVKYTPGAYEKLFFNPSHLTTQIKDTMETVISDYSDQWEKDKLKDLITTDEEYENVKQWLNNIITNWATVDPTFKVMADLWGHIYEAATQDASPIDAEKYNALANVVGLIVKQVAGDSDILDQMLDMEGGETEALMDAVKDLQVLPGHQKWKGGTFGKGSEKFMEGWKGASKALLMFLLEKYVINEDNFSGVIEDALAKPIINAKMWNSSPPYNPSMNQNILRITTKFPEFGSYAHANCCRYSPTDYAFCGGAEHRPGCSYSDNQKDAVAQIKNGTGGSILGWNPLC